MKKEDIIELTQEELVKQIDDDKALYAKLKFNHKVTELENPMKLNHMRKDIARLLTEKRKRVMAGTDVITDNAKEKTTTKTEIATKEKKKPSEKKAAEAKVKAEVKKEVKAEAKKEVKKEPKEVAKKEPAKTEKKEESKDK